MIYTLIGLLVVAFVAVLYIVIWCLRYELNRFRLKIYDKMMMNEVKNGQTETFNKLCDMYWKEQEKMQKKAENLSKVPKWLQGFLPNLSGYL